MKYVETHNLLPKSQYLDKGRGIASKVVKNKTPTVSCQVDKIDKK